MSKIVTIIIVLFMTNNFIDLTLYIFIYYDNNFIDK